MGNTAGAIAARLRLKESDREDSPTSDEEMRSAMTHPEERPVDRSERRSKQAGSVQPFVRSIVHDGVKSLLYPFRRMRLGITVKVIDESYWYRRGGTPGVSRTWKAPRLAHGEA